MSAMEGHNKKECVDELKAKFWPTYKVFILQQLHSRTFLFKLSEHLEVICSCVLCQKCVFIVV